jgi:hypothetical protein
VRYLFLLDTASLFNSPLCLRISGIRDNRYVLPWPGTFLDAVYYWNIAAVDKTGRATWTDRAFTLQLATAVRENQALQVPSNYLLNQNYPNPFNAETVIVFGLPRPGRASLFLYNSHGQRVRVLADGEFREGYHTVHWDGKDAEGKRLSTGIYVIQIVGQNFRISKKAILLQ